MVFFKLRKLLTRHVKVIIALVISSLVLIFYNITKNDVHSKIISLVSNSPHKSIDYKTDEWVFNYNVSQYSSIISIDRESASIESLIFMDIAEKDLTSFYLNNNLKCLVSTKDNQLRLEIPTSIMKINLMPIEYWPKSSIYRIECQFKNNVDFSDVKFAIVDAPSISNTNEDEIVRSR